MKAEIEVKNVHVYTGEGSIEIISTIYSSLVARDGGLGAIRFITTDGDVTLHDVTSKKLMAMADDILNVAVKLGQAEASHAVAELMAESRR